MIRTLPARLALVLAALLLALVGCSDSGAGGGAAGDDGPIEVTASDDACDVGTSELPAGSHVFAVNNTGSQVTEFYVYAEGDRVMGEIENIAPGLTRELRVELPAGTYETACKPGMVGTGIRNDLTVTGEAQALTEDEALSGAVDNYTRYAQSQVVAFQEETREFVDLINAGDIPGAQAQYPIARTYFERIEPVAEKFGDLDPRIDGREGDQEPGVEWTGFHRLEKDLWVAGDVSASGPIADQLMADVNELVDRVNEIELAPLDLANGAQGLLDEVATGKITGEEERYSHTDLWDFQANLEGTEAAVQALRPFVEEAAPDLVEAIDAEFANASGQLEQYRSGDGWLLWTELTEDQLQGLSDAVNALAEQVSQLAAVVANN